MAKYTVRLRGRGVDQTTAYHIISRGKQAKTEKHCPYRPYQYKWSIWVTAFRNKKRSHGEIWQALKEHGVKCDE